MILGSGSPRRRGLLEEEGYEFEVKVSDVVEPGPEGFASPEAYVTHLAWLKANALKEIAGEDPRWILTADTTVVAQGHILGKAVDRADARRILNLLRGTRHLVLTGVCLWLPEIEISLVLCEKTYVIMRAVSDAELEAYLDTGLWEGKAGAYGIQDAEDPFVERFEGSYSNVVGLPMERVRDLLARAELLTGRSLPRSN